MALLSIQDVADMCGLSPSQIRRLVRKDVIKAHKVGSYYAIDDRTAQAFKRSRMTDDELKEME